MNSSMTDIIQTIENGTTPHDIELQRAFALVEDKDDWRGPIDATIRCDQVGIVREAIIHFTATKPSFHSTEIPGQVRVVSAGYRNGPAGP